VNQQLEWEWSVFRTSDGDDGTPAESLRWPSRDAAQKFIVAMYAQPEFWEARGRVVGRWQK